METVATAKAHDKRRYYAAVLGNSLTVDAPEWDRQQRMVAVLDELRPSHLRVLALIVRVPGLRRRVQSVGCRSSQRRPPTAR
jgi:hypothetical protein